VNDSCRSALLALSALCLVIFGRARAGEPYQKSPDGIVVEPGGGAARRVRLQVMSDRIIRVTAVPAQTVAPPGSLMVTATPPGNVPFSARRVRGKIELRTKSLAADVALDTGAVSFLDPQGRVLLAERDGGSFTPVKIEGKSYYSVQQVFNPGTDEAFYGLGQHQNGQMNYNGEDVLLAQHNMDVAIPFVLSNRNYGVLWDNDSITRFGDPRPYAPVSRDLRVYDAKGRAGGFTAKYFVDGKLKVERTEPDIDYQYMKDLGKRPKEILAAEVSNTSAQPVDVAKLSVLWEGKLETRKSGVHKFQLYASSYFKLYLDGKLIKEGWRQNWNPWYHDFDYEMTAGKPVNVRLEWIADDGFVALLHNDPLPAPTRHSLSLASEAGQAIDYYYIAGDNLDEVIGGYRQLTGKAVMLPRWAYGFWQSRQRYKSQAEILDVVREYRKRGIPLDNIVEDWHYWREPEWGSHEFDPERFPDPKGMIEQLHQMNTHFMISVWPKFYPTTANYRELDAKGYIYRRNVELGVHDWVGPQGYLNSFYDPYTEQARSIYWRQIRDKLAVLGVDAWWLDASEPDIHSNIDVAENKKRIGPTALGPGAAFYNSYPLMHTTAVYQGARAMGDKRVFILTRSAFGGQQRNAAATWSGDVASRWGDLRRQISAGVNFSMSGIPNWTFDIGGFALERRYLNPSTEDLAEWRELNTRWFEFGAFVPLFRSHGEEPYREIFNLAPKGSEIYRTLVWYDELRYRLLPYIYTLAADSYHRDGTIMRGLAMDFAQDREVLGIDDEYLFGPSLLVSPVYEYRARKRKVYLPAGTSWYDFYSGNVLRGGEWIETAAPLNRMPVFVKAGAIIPLGPRQEFTGQKPDAPITLYVYTGAAGKFELYEDDGTTYGYERGQFSRIPLTYDDATGTLSIGARSGEYPRMPRTRTFNVRWISGPTDPVNFDARADATVQYSGQPLKVVRPAEKSTDSIAHPALWPQAHSVGLVDEKTEKVITGLMARMSLQEKVGQMIQADVASITPEDLRKYPLGSILAGGNSPPLSGDDRDVASEWLATTRRFHQVALERRAGHVPIPLIFGIDAVHGNSNVKGATVFPHNVALGAMRDPDLVRRIAAATAEETAAVGIDWAFAPTLAVARDKRWGRTYEGFAEDPALVRQYAPEFVLGLQGEPGVGKLIQRGHVAATAKHFLGDGGTAEGIDQGDTEVSEGELIRIHGQGYPAAIDAGLMTVMVSYSSWNGQKMHGNASLLTGVLKGRMGFEGFVVSDWNGHSQLPGCDKGHCPAAYNAGLDMVMAPDGWKDLFENTIAEVRTGVIPMSRVDDAVRRILRVKLKMGLFEPDRPWEGKLDVLGSAAHRALAREAVRKSLVLLKNNGHVLPVKARGHILVVGSSADDIGRQCGGWTLSWQGTGNTNSDFPNGQSIYSALHDAVAPAGGEVELSHDGSFKRKPDVVIAVLGEDPAAEMRGDLRSIDYQAEHPDDLALLQKLKAIGVPVVTVFLSGRPLWVNPLLNASDAFVAAWFPGTEGAGVADVLIGDAQGKARYDFAGRLPMSWPKSAAQTTLNVGQKSYDPLFAYGYGPNHESQAEVGTLDENPGVKVIQGSVDKYFVAGRMFAPWRFALRANGKTTLVPDRTGPFSVGGGIAIAPIDAGGVQEGGRQVTWSGQSDAAVLLTGMSLDLLRQANADMSLQIDYRIDQAPGGAVRLQMGCDPTCADGGVLAIEPILRKETVGQWHTLKVPLACFRERGTDLKRIAQPMMIRSASRLQLSIAAVSLASDAKGAVCPSGVRGDSSEQ
jgi:alpha-D-xyloside xylohydrolase